MKTSEFLRKLKKLGVIAEDGSRHTKLYFQGKQSVIPRHSKEIAEGTRKAIMKQLQITENEIK